MSSDQIHANHSKKCRVHGILAISLLLTCGCGDEISVNKETESESINRLKKLNKIQVRLSVEEQDGTVCLACGVK